MYFLHKQRFLHSERRDIFGSVEPKQPWMDADKTTFISNFSFHSQAVCSLNPTICTNGSALWRAPTEFFFCVSL